MFLLDEKKRKQLLRSWAMNWSDFTQQPIDDICAYYGMKVHTKNCSDFALLYPNRMYYKRKNTCRADRHLFYVPRNVYEVVTFSGFVGSSSAVGGLWVKSRTLCWCASSVNLYQLQEAQKSFIYLDRCNLLFFHFSSCPWYHGLSSFSNFGNARTQPFQLGVYSALFTITNLSLFSRFIYSHFLPSVWCRLQIYNSASSESEYRSMKTEPSLSRFPSEHMRKQNTDRMKEKANFQREEWFSWLLRVRNDAFIILSIICLQLPFELAYAHLYEVLGADVLK